MWLMNIFCFLGFLGVCVLGFIFGLVVVLGFVWVGFEVFFRCFIGCLLVYFWLLCLCGFWGEGDESAWLVSKIGC